MSHAKRKLSAIVAAAMLFVLSGCVVFDMNFTVDADMKVSGDTTFAFVVEELDSLGLTAEELLGDIEEEFGADDLPPGASFTPIDDGELYGFEIGYDKIPGAEIDFNSSSPATFTQEGDVIVFNLENPFFDEEIEEDPDDPFAGMFTGSSVLTSGEVTITFPGEVMEAPGATIDGNTATWDLTTYSEEYLTAQGSAIPTPGAAGGGATPTDQGTTPGAGAASQDPADTSPDASEDAAADAGANTPTTEEESNVLTYALIAVAAVAAIAIVAGVIAMNRRKKRENAATAGPQTAGYAPQQPGAAPYGYPQQGYMTPGQQPGGYPAQGGPTAGDPQYGGQQYGNQPYGGQQYGQPPYTQQPYGQAPNGQAANGQAHPGQSYPDQSQYGQPPYPPSQDQPPYPGGDGQQPPQ